MAGNFNQQVYAAVSKVPFGTVTTYGYIATMIGRPRAARIVGWALRNLPEGVDVPWWRIINSQGYISIQNPHAPKELQKLLLEKEGIEVSDKLMVNLNRYLWRPHHVNAGSRFNPEPAKG